MVFRPISASLLISILSDNCQVGVSNCRNAHFRSTAIPSQISGGNTDVHDSEHSDDSDLPKLVKKEHYGSEPQKIFYIFHE